MKILRVLLILLVPAMGIVGCSKSDIKPACTENKATPAPEPANQEVSGRMINGVEILEEETEPKTIVGQGDDDRDGGDRKPKTAGR